MCLKAGWGGSIEEAEKRTLQARQHENVSTTEKSTLQQ